LTLKISPLVPDPPETLTADLPFSVKRIKIGHAPEADGLRAYLLDIPYIRENAAEIRAAGFPAGSVLIWNPDGGERLEEGLLPEELIFGQIPSWDDPVSLQRTLRNQSRRLTLERELAEKDGQLKERSALNEELLQVGIALSAERDNDKLLSYIVKKIREITGADAGSLYLLTKDEATGEQKLLFKIAQNDSNPAKFNEFEMPLNKRSVGGYVVSSGRILSIKDAYLLPADGEYSFRKDNDISTGYRSKSMLTVPMRDHKGDIIGAIQLINRKKDFSVILKSPQDAENLVIPFSKEQEPLVLSLASQAAVSLENNLLYQEIETLFEGFVKAAVQAIESRDPTTSGHSSRVALYTVELAKAVDHADHGAYKDVRFNVEQMKSIRYASLLHDFGKVGVRENVLVKSKKLYPEQLELVKQRFAYIRKAMLHSLMRERFDLLAGGGMEAYRKGTEEFDRREKEYMAEMDRYLATVVSANEPALLEDNPMQVLDEIHGKTFQEQGGQVLRFLTDDEHVKLRIRRGSLDEAERREIESHVTHSFRFLTTIPWTKEMRRIPEIAYGHHEKLTGDGYPRKMQARDLSLETRMMAIADIFDALTASDRPYKRAVPCEQALEIIKKEAQKGALDSDLVDLFIEAKVYAKKDEAAQAPKAAG